MTTKTWRVGGGVVASTYVGEVEAPTWEEAIARAADEADVSLCHECARKISDPEIDHFWAEDVETGDVTGEETPHDTVVKLHKQVESLKAELELAHSMHNVAVKERDFYKTRLAHAEADAEQAVAVLQGERDEALLCARVEADNFDEARDALREIAEAPCVWSDPAPFCKCPTCQARGALKTLGKGKPKK